MNSLEKKLKFFLDDNLSDRYFRLRLLSLILNRNVIFIYLDEPLICSESKPRLDALLQQFLDSVVILLNNPSNHISSQGYNLLNSLILSIESERGAYHSSDTQKSQIKSIIFSIIHILKFFLEILHADYTDTGTLYEKMLTFLSYNQKLIENAAQYMSPPGDRNSFARECSNDYLDMINRSFPDVRKKGKRITQEYTDKKSPLTNVYALAKNKFEETTSNDVAEVFTLYEELLLRGITASVEGLAPGIGELSSAENTLEIIEESAVLYKTEASHFDFIEAFAVAKKGLDRNYICEECFIEYLHNADNGYSEHQVTEILRQAQREGTAGKFILLNASLCREVEAIIKNAINSSANAAIGNSDPLLSVGVLNTSNLSSYLAHFLKEQETIQDILQILEIRGDCVIQTGNTYFFYKFEETSQETDKKAASYKINLAPRIYIPLRRFFQFDSQLNHKICIQKIAEEFSESIALKIINGTTKRHYETNSIELKMTHFSILIICTENDDQKTIDIYAKLTRQAVSFSRIWATLAHLKEMKRTASKMSLVVAEELQLQMRDLEENDQVIKKEKIKIISSLHRRWYRNLKKHLQPKVVVLISIGGSLLLLLEHLLEIFSRLLHIVQGWFN